jgi:serine/threonine protein phosphatase PrpC
MLLSPENAPAAKPIPDNACKHCATQPLALDDDGFCSSCGMKPTMAKPSARASIDLGPHLACVSDVGRRHAVNQDAACVSEMGPWVLMAVADGVSSAHLSEQASMDATQAWLAQARASLMDGRDPETAMRDALSAAHQAVLLIDFDRHATELDEPETTIVASISSGGLATLGWAGDSRAYAFGPGGSHGRLLTIDDSWLQSTLDAGISQRSAERDPRAHAITQCLGTRDAPPEPHVITVALHEREQLLLCSDGLWNYFAEPSQIGPSLALPTALSCCEDLASRANAQGGRDNITIALWRPETKEA